MRIVFLNRFYWPDEPATAQLLTDLAERLAARGHDVLVVTSHSGDSRLPRQGHHHGVTIVRLGRIRTNCDSIGRKAAAWGAFLIAATVWLIRHLRGTDTVVAMTDPPLLALGAWFACGIRGASLFHWIQDVYPELAIELTRHRWLAVLRPVRNLAWCRARACVTLGSDMAAVLAENGVPRERIALVANWAPAGLEPAAPAEIAELRHSWGLTGKFVVAYSGNLGRVHDLDPILGLAHELRSDGQIVFLFVGGGAQRTRLQSEVARRQLANVHFRPPQPRSLLRQSLGVGDVHLVTLLPGCERFVFPSKFYGVVAVGRPVVFIGPAACQLASLVRDHGLGITGERHAVTSIAEGLRALANDAGRLARHHKAALRFAAESGGADAAAERWHGLLSPASLSPRTPAPNIR